MFSLANIKSSFYEISGNEKINNEDVNFIEDEFNDFNSKFDSLNSNAYESVRVSLYPDSSEEPFDGMVVKVKVDSTNIFDQKVKSLLDQYMEIGRYTFKVDNYNEFDEELDYGRYKIDFSTDHEYRDSLYIIYEEVYD